MSDFMRQKRALIAEIKKMVRPLLRDSGYNKALDPKKGILGPGRPWRIWCPNQGDKVFKLTRAFVLTEFIGISEDGPITDAYGHGASWTAYEGLPVEDLFRLRNWLQRRIERKLI